LLSEKTDRRYPLRRLKRPYDPFSPQGCGSLLIGAMLGAGLGLLTAVVANHFIHPHPFWAKLVEGAVIAGGLIGGAVFGIGLALVIAWFVRD